MGYAERDVRVADPRVERAEAERPLGVFDCLFAAAGMAKDDGPLSEHICRSAVYPQRSLDRVHCRVVIMGDKADRETRSRECLRIVGPGLDRGPRMLERSLLVRFPHAAAHVAYLMAQSRCGVSSGIIRLKCQCLAKQRERFVRPAWHMNAKMWKRAQVEIVGIKAVRPLALGPLDFGVQ
jgi:hypothetical protein